MENKKRGRPKGIKKSERLHVIISNDLKKRYQKVVDFECTNISVKTCELILEYVKKIEKSNKKEW